MRRLVPPTLAAALLLAACSGTRPSGAPAATPSTPAPSPPPAPSPSPEAATFPVERALEHVRVLAGDVGARNGGSAGERRAADYVESVLRGHGYEVTRQAVARPDGGGTHNLVGRRPGVDYAGGYLVVGGHYDTVAGSPGANDNASGTAVVLAVAEALAGRPPVELIAFAAEERQPPTGAHHIGSEVYVAALADRGVVRAMLSVDMVGNGPSLLVGRYRDGPAALQSEVVAACRALAFPCGLVERGDVSDHVPFARAGIPAAWLWTGDHPTFHKASDSVDVVRADALAWAGGTVLEWIRLRDVGS